jgi:uncharacterized protein
MLENMISPSVMAEADCLTALRTERIGRIVLTQHAMPLAVPVSYLVTSTGVVVRVPADDVCDCQAVGSVVALEADARDDDGGWSVLVLGMAQPVTESSQIDEFDRVLPTTWADTTRSNGYLRIPFSLVSGRRLGQCLGPMPVSGDGSRG